MPHYYSQKQDAPLIEYPLKARLRGHEIELTSASGVFSAKQVDKGTRILIDYCVLQPGWDVLDLGCGYGAVGIALAKTCRLGRVVLSDVNERAVHMAKKNAKRHGLDAEILHSDMFSKITGAFDTILLNPPQSAGKDICTAMIAQAKDHLKQGGLLQLVCRHNKGGRMLSEKMKETFGNVKDVARKSGYRVYVSQRL